MGLLAGGLALLAACSGSDDSSDTADTTDGEADRPPAEADASDDAPGPDDVPDAIDAEVDVPPPDADTVDGEPDAEDVPDAGEDAADSTDGETDGWSVYERASLSVTPGWAPGGSIAMLCHCEGDLPPPAEILAAEGGCTLTHDPTGEGLDLSPCRPLDFGEIQMGHEGDTWILGPSAEVPFACAFSFGAGLPDFQPGDEVRLTGTGGSELPAFDVVLTFPPSVTLAAPAMGTTLVAGEPWETRWNPAIEVHATFLYAGLHLALSCSGTGVPPLAAPASVTALWDEFDRFDMLNFRVTSEEVIPGDPPLRLELGCCSALPMVSVEPAP